MQHECNPIARMAMFLALIRPQKRFVGQVMGENWQEYLDYTQMVLLF